MKYRFLPLLASAVLCMYSCNGGEKVLLRLDLQPNKKIDLKYRTFEYAEKENGSPLKTEYVRMTLKVDRLLPDSSYQFLAKCDFIRVTDPSMLGDEEYTSDKDLSQLSEAGQRLDERLNPSIDSLYQFTIDRQGKIVKPLTFASGRPITRDFALINLNIFQINFPAEAIGVGEEWTNQAEVPSLGYKSHSTYKIESIYDNTVQIVANGDVDGDSADAKKFTGRYYLNKENYNLDSCRLEFKAADKGLTIVALAAK